MPATQQRDYADGRVTRAILRGAERRSFSFDDYSSRVCVTPGLSQHVPRARGISLWNAIANRAPAFYTAHEGWSAGMGWPMRHLKTLTRPKVVSARVQQGVVLDFLEKQLRNALAGLGDKDSKPEPQQ